MTTTPAREAIRDEAFEDAAKECLALIDMIGAMPLSSINAALRDAANRIRALKGQSSTKDAPDMAEPPQIVKDILFCAFSGRTSGMTLDQDEVEELAELLAGDAFGLTKTL